MSSRAGLNRLCRACTTPGSLQAGLLLPFDACRCGQGRTMCAPVSVDPEGVEPSTFSMPLRRAPNCAMGPRRCIKQPAELGSTYMDLKGVEPLTSSVRLRRAPNCATGPTRLEYTEVNAACQTSYFFGSRPQRFTNPPLTPTGKRLARGYNEGRVSSFSEVGCNAQVLTISRY